MGTLVGLSLGSTDSCDEMLGLFVSTMAGLSLSSADALLEEVGGRKSLFVGQPDTHSLEEGSALNYQDEVESNDSGALDCNVGVKVGQPETNGWSVGSCEGAALNDG